MGRAKQAKFEQLAHQMREQLHSGLWRPGEKLPSLREKAAHCGLSLMTVLHTYQLLESEGRIVSRPQSGYYVAPNIVRPATPLACGEAVQLAEKVDVNDFIFDVLRASRSPAVVPFGSAFPDPRLFPQRQLTRSLAQVARRMQPESAVDSLPPGNEQLRKQIAQRYALQGIAVSPDEIVITSGALESLNLCLQWLTRPGDYVVIESPAFYGALQAIERLQLKAITIAADPHTGIDLAALEQALQHYPIRACWLMTNFHNPLGYTLSWQKKQQLAALLRTYQVALIEDDVYGELYSGKHRPLPVKALDSDGRMLHCASFSKNLVAGFRVGWVAAGHSAEGIQRLQLMSTLATSAPMQLAIADYLATSNYDSHLRRLRRTLAQRKQRLYQAMKACFPAEVDIYYAEGGYFIWLGLPEGSNSITLYQQALAQGISLAPGRMFTTDDRFDRYFRINASFEWQSKTEQAVRKLAELLRQALAQG
ncbi:PLP-dependent aminotransferase family protein [Dickeya lacustris]|uniref:aminotransferase-like domain-containing protein n=1 Tax=Dickeya lacustris TaxID=2259638 RepID=UPI0022BA6185|nr:PLP-dependent aminotransferase family protein [Dickeya lacustris]